MSNTRIETPTVKFLRIFLALRACYEEFMASRDEGIFGWDANMYFGEPTFEKMMPMFKYASLYKAQSHSMFSGCLDCNTKVKSLLEGHPSDFWKAALSILREEGLDTHDFLEAIQEEDLHHGGSCSSVDAKFVLNWIAMHV